MRPAKFYAGIATAVLAMFASLAILASISITPTPKPPIRSPLIVTASEIDVPAPKLRAPISESQAVARMRAYINAYDPYDVPRDCLDIHSTGRDGAVYTVEVANRCDAQRASLGQWHVDAITRAVYRQR